MAAVGRKPRQNNVVGVAFKVDADLWRLFQERAEKKGVSQTRFLQDAIKFFLNDCDECIYQRSFDEISIICERALK